jgi:hypothetical protein
MQQKSIVGEVKLPNIDEQWLRPQTLVHNRENFTKVIGQKTKFSRVKNSSLPAVEAPHPGISFKTPSDKAGINVYCFQANPIIQPLKTTKICCRRLLIMKDNSSRKKSILKGLQPKCSAKRQTFQQR